jgi:predicted peptidase
MGLAVSRFPVIGGEEFLGRVYTNQTGATLPYRLLLPANYDASRAYPVVLFLHGAAARGADNLKPLDWGPRLIAGDMKRGRHEFFLVVPQCPRGDGWSNTVPGGQPLPEASLKLALEVITNSLAKEFHLDPTRRYLTGVSMGGHATWALLCEGTGVFAAAVPVCAGGDASGVTDHNARVPVWVFHSDDDHLVPVQQARAFVKAWRAHGGEARYSEYTGLKHSSWKKAYTEPELYDWLFAQRRQ